MTSHTGLQLQASCSIDFLIIHPPRKKNQQQRRCRFKQLCRSFRAKRHTRASAQRGACSRLLQGVAVIFEQLLSVAVAAQRQQPAHNL